MKKHGSKPCFFYKLILEFEKKLKSILNLGFFLAPFKIHSKVGKYANFLYFKLKASKYFLFSGAFNVCKSFLTFLAKIIFSIMSTLDNIRLELTNKEIRIQEKEGITQALARVLRESNITNFTKKDLLSLAEEISNTDPNLQ